MTEALGREGTTLTHEIHQLKLDIACAALKDPDRSISEIAADLGYHEAANFTRFFRSQTGMSPRAYRKSHLDR